jgi:hypothetical protein
MKENMNRRTFVTQGCACGALLLAGTSPGISETTETKPPKDDLTHPVNPPQVMAVLTDIDRSGDKSLIDAVFTRWGYQCFHTRGDLKAFAEKQRANFQGYVDYVNGNRSRYWEKLEYDKDSGIIKVTSRKFGKCVCAYAQCQQPAKALCTHCCKALQTELFKAMTGRDVTVQIDESILLGGERCRTTVHILEKKQNE